MVGEFRPETNTNKLKDEKQKCSDTLLKPC